MSVQAIGQDNTNSWLAQMLASYSGQTSSAASSLASLLGTSGSTSDDSANSSSSSSTSSVGSFNDILQALLSGNGSVGYDMTTGSLTDLSSSAQAGTMPPPPGEGMDGINREVSETENEDGSVSRSVTMTDADGKVVGTEKTTQNADGSYSTVMTMVQADGTTMTRSMTGSYDADGKFVEKNTLTAADGTVLESGTVTTAEDGSFTSTMTGPDGKTTTHSASGAYADDGSFTVKSSLADADGNILESGTEITAADGSSTYTVTRTGPDGKTATETESYDASGALVSTSTSTPTTGASSGTSQAAGASGSSGTSDSASGSSGSEDTITTVTTAFTTEGMTQTTVVTDANGKVLNKSVKDFPFSTKAEGQAYGASEASKDGLSSMLDQYAKGRYGADRYAAMAASGSSDGQSGFSAQA